MDLQLNDKVILVTGGAKGIGAAICRGAIAEGALAIIIDRDQQAGDTLVSELGQDKVRSITADLCRTEDCRLAVTKALESFGRLDCLVNNAGINDNVGLERGTPEEFLASLESNLLHYYNVAHYALAALKQSRGTIVNIASKVAVTGQGNASGYVAAKGAILALTREWAAELLSAGVRVNAVVPAEVMTPLYRWWVNTFPDPEQKLSSIVSHIPLGRRMTKPEEIAATVLFLLSPRSSHTTGQHVFADGGYTHLDRALT
jgi:NAD(P)-dependent dehydrogenase (short-subunit alcohol dehydrogenase family)